MAITAHVTAATKDKNDINLRMLILNYILTIRKSFNSIYLLQKILELCGNPQHSAKTPFTAPHSRLVYVGGTTGFCA